MGGPSTPDIAPNDGDRSPRRNLNAYAAARIRVQVYRTVPHVAPNNPIGSARVRTITPSPIITHAPIGHHQVHCPRITRATNYSGFQLWGTLKMAPTADSLSNSSSSGSPARGKRASEEQGHSPPMKRRRSSLLPRHVVHANNRRRARETSERMRQTTRNMLNRNASGLEVLR